VLGSHGQWSIHIAVTTAELSQPFHVGFNIGRLKAANSILSGGV
jgi:hypothetical protein